MTQPLIDISHDATHTEGGHAIVLVRDVTELPDPLRFSVRALPDDVDDTEIAPEWSLDERSPLSAELAADGLVMKIGPEIVDAPELQPGTPVLLSIPAVNINAEVIWPDLPITIPSRLPSPLMAPSELRVHKIEHKRREAAAAAQAEADRAMVDAIAASLSADPPPPDDVIESEPAAVINLSDLTTALRPSASTAATPQSDIAQQKKLNINQATASLPSMLHLALDGPPPATPKNRPPNAGAAMPELPTMTIPRSRAIVPVGPVIVADPELDSIARRNWFSIVLAIVAIPVMLFALWPSLTTRLVEQPTVQAAMKQLASSDWVTRVFAVGDVSPDGIDASSVTANEALNRAEAAIFDEAGKTDLAERRFWLRKSISLMLAKPDTQWAMTQLGTLHTATLKSEKDPHYRSAKTLWEIASASGDTVATCFLAQLHELGLGVVVSEDKARQWQARAAARGGCNVKHERSTPALTN